MDCFGLKLKTTPLLIVCTELSGNKTFNCLIVGMPAKTIDGLTNTHPYRIGISTENEVQVHLTLSE